MADKNITLEEQIVVEANEAIKALENIKKSVKGVRDEASKSSKNGILGDMFKKTLGGLGMAFSMKKLVGFIKTANKEAMELIETTNLFEVSFGKGIEGLNEYYEKAIKFQNKLSDTLGTNLNESMNYQALFNSMGKSMGLDEAVAYQISENFTKLGYDLASLYNTETDKAMQKLQSGLSGSSTRPLRAFGIDITQNTLANTLSDLGINKTIGQLNQAEKMVLRYIAVLRQSSIAHGDFARTLESPANQIRVFQAQLLAFRQNVGSLWQGLLQQWMPYINGILMAINAIIKAFASLFGFKASVSSMSESLRVGAGGAGGIADGLDKAGGSAKKLKEQLDLMPWDEIHNIELGKDTSSGGSGVSGGGGGGGIDQGLLDAMAEYDNMMDKISNKATDIRDKIMEWLGFEKQVNEETGEIEWKLKEGYQKIELIRDILEGLALGTVALKLAKLFFSPEQLKSLAEGTTLLEKLKLIGGAIILSIGVVEITNGLRDDDLKEKLIGILSVGAGSGLMFGWKGGLLGLSIAVELTLALSMIKWGFENFDNQAEKLYGHIEGLSVWQKLNVFMNGIGKGFIDEIGKAFGEEDFAENGFQDLIKGTKEYFSTSKANFEQWKDDMKMGWYLYWEDVKTGAGNWADDMLSKALGFETSWYEFENTVTDPKTWDQYWNTVKTDAKNWADDMLSNALGFETSWDEFTATVTDKTAWDQYWTNVKTGAQSWKDEMLKRFDEVKTNTSNKITEMKDNATKKFDEFKTNASKKIDELKTNITTKFEEIKNGIVNKINTARDKVREAIDKIKSFFSGEFKLNIKIPKFKVNWDSGDSIMAKAFKKLGFPGKPDIDIEWFAEGGFPTTGELFMAREAGPELVGTMNGRNAVANNAQIVEGIKQGVYEAVSQAMSQYGGVQIEARVDEGILLKKVQNQAMQYRMQTGRAPFPAV